LPTLTVALYYFNFQRFITPENENTLISKIRRVCQMFLIIWYPFLCSWPSGIVLYMCSNALVSVLQTSIMKSRWWMQMMNQKILLYTSIMQSVEYDKGTSEGIIQGIRKG
jgi:membrane protein insertase Oxa1/YidC/SpoIIIJ